MQKNDFEVQKTALKYTDSGRKRTKKNIKNPQKITKTKIES